MPAANEGKIPFHVRSVLGSAASSLKPGDDVTKGQGVVEHAARMGDVGLATNLLPENFRAAESQERKTGSK